MSDREGGRSSSADTFIVTARPSGKNESGTREAMRTATLPDGQRVRVISRDRLERAISAAMKDFAKS